MTLCRLRGSPSLEGPSDLLFHRTLSASSAYGGGGELSKNVKGSESIWGLRCALFQRQELGDTHGLQHGTCHAHYLGSGLQG